MSNEVKCPCIDGTLSDVVVRQLASRQGNRCRLCEQPFDGYVRVRNGAVFPLTPHAVQFVYEKPHEHVDVVVCCACFSILTDQELPLTDTDKTPLVFIARGGRE